MKYCPNCHVLVDGTRCTVCGSKNLRGPEGEDFCFFAEKELIWAATLEDLLRQNKIPFATENAKGAWLTTRLGQALERKRFYVPYAHYETARALETDFFSGDFVPEENE